MTAAQIIQLAIAAALFAFAIFLYRRRAHDPAEGGYGSQSAILLGLAAVLLAVHALGVMNRILS